MLKSATPETTVGTPGEEKLVNGPGVWTLVNVVAAAVAAEAGRPVVSMTFGTETDTELEAVSGIESEGLKGSEEETDVEEARIEAAGATVTTEVIVAVAV